MNFLTVKELAERYGVARRVASGWCERGLLPNALKKTSELGVEYWQIPESDLTNFVKPSGRGKPRLSNPSKETLAKRQLRESKTDRPPKVKDEN